MITRIGPAAATCALWLWAALPASAQIAPPAVAQVDAAALIRFDPDGATGIPLTKELIRAYFAQPIQRPTQEQFMAVRDRMKAADAARRVLLANETLFAPQWEQDAFELKDGSVRPMTADEKAVFREVDAAEAAQQTLYARTALADYDEDERIAYADSLCRLLDAGIRITTRSDGYRKVGDDWLWFDWESGRMVGSRAPDPQAEIALLRHELVAHRISSAVIMRRQAVRFNAQTVTAPPF